MEDGACLGVQRGQVSLANMSVVPPGVGRDSMWVWEERVSLQLYKQEK